MHGGDEKERCGRMCFRPVHEQSDTHAQPTLWLEQASAWPCTAAVAEGCWLGGRQGRQLRLGYSLPCRLR